MVKQAQTIRIERGIGRFDFSDYYAILGLPIAADGAEVRKRYLKVAKQLHPDVYGRSPEEREQATQYFSKLVNPAYTVLSQERERTEFQAILKLLAKRFIKRGHGLGFVQAESAKRLLAASEFERSYAQAIAELAPLVYGNLTGALERIGELSELNFVYLLRREGYQVAAPATPAPAKPAMGGVDTAVQRRTPPQPAATPKGASSGATKTVPQHIAAAEQYIAQQDWKQALRELRAATTLDANNSYCFALQGVVYMHQKLNSMARASFQHALKLNPKEPLALQYIDRVAGAASQHSAAKSANSGTSPQGKGEDKKGGFFRWFGG